MAFSGDYQKLIREVEESQKKLRKENSNHSLLSLVTMSKAGITWEEGFREEYKDGSTYEKTQKYVVDLKLAVEERR